MAVVKIFTVKNERAWKPIFNELEKRGLEINYEYANADVAIVLGGRYTNPLLWPERILFYNSTHWGNTWEGVFKPVVKEYYDKMIDATYGNLEGIVGKIIEEFDCYSLSSEDGLKRTG